MVFGSPPYRADNHIHLLRMIESSDDSMLPFPSNIKFKQSMRRASSAPSKFSKDKQEIITVNIETTDTFRDLLSKLLKKDPTKRISFEDFFSHPFVCESCKMPIKSSVKNSSSESVTFAPTISSFSESRRQSQSTTTASSLYSQIEDSLKLEEDNNLLLEAFDDINSKPPVIYISNFIFMLYFIVIFYD